jgi:hypothetical protein
MIFPSATYCLFKVDQAPEQNGTALLPRPVGRPSQKRLVEYKGFLYQAATWQTARTMERYASLLGKSGDAGRWAQLASTYAEKTRQLCRADG